MRFTDQIRKDRASVHVTGDIFAGIMVALVSIPISMGYAQIAGLPAVYGLYGSLLPILVFGFLTTSPQFVVGVDAMPAVMVGSLLAQLGIAAESEDALDLVPLVSILVGVCFLLFYFLKAGRVVKYISTPVMGGFISGVGLTMILMQIPKLFGGDPGTGTLLPLLVHLVREAPAFQPLSFCLGLGTVIIILVCKKRIPKVPMTVVMLAAGALLQVIFHLDRYGVRLLTAVEGGLPRILLPRVGVAQGHVTEVLFEAFSISLVIMAQSLLCSGSYAMKYGDRLDTNAELLAYAGMNFTGALFGCAPINGSVSRSAIADSLHCRSQVMSISASATMLAVLLAGTPLLRFLPVPILTGIVMSALIGILEIQLAKRLWSTSKNEWIIFMISFLGVLLFGTVNGVIVGTVLSFFEVSIRAANPPRAFVGRIPGQSGYFSLERNRNASPIRHVVIYRFSGNLFFANIDRFEQDIRDAVKSDTRCVIVDARRIGSVDITAVDHLLLLAKSLENQGIRFYLTEHGGSLNDMLRRLGGEYLLQNGMVRRTITLALRDAGFRKPFELEDGGRAVKDLPEDTQNSDERLAEMVWAFGDEAEIWLERLAAEAAEGLAAGDERSAQELNLEEDSGEGDHRVHTRWGTLGRFDENAFWDYLEMHLEMLHTEGKVGDEHLQTLESRIEARRAEGENSLKKFSPHGIELLYEERKKLRGRLKEERPEECEHIRQVRDSLRERTAEARNGEQAPKTERTEREEDMDMDRSDHIRLFGQMHPGFFEKEDIRQKHPDQVCEEMILPLAEFDPDAAVPTCEGDVTFGYYDGDRAKLLKAVGLVEEHWPQLFGENDRVYCGYLEGKLASFCIVEDMGSFTLGGRKVKIGGPGCVGTLPEYRRRGIGLAMVARVTGILKQEGYDYSYIHYTGVASWYAKLGYETILKWNCNGILPEQGDDHG